MFQKTLYALGFAAVVSVYALPSVAGASIESSFDAEPAFSVDPPPTVALSELATTYHMQQVGEVEVFYRAAGSKEKPVVLLLHGYPSSSHMFRKLIPELAMDYRVIAPDLPGFGSTHAPQRGEYEYSFDNLAATILGFTEALKLESYALYIFDYGAPVGFRLAMAHPERITAIVTQNGNAYEAGLTPAWAPLRTFWSDASVENRNALRPLLARQTTEWQYTAGTPPDLLSRISPDAIAHDQAILDREGSDEIQLDLFGSYKTNVVAYPAWQQYLRDNKPPVLAIWGKNDPFFGPAGAEAFKQDVPDAQVELIDAGHFPLETHLEHIADRMRAFLSEVHAR